MKNIIAMLACLSASAASAVTVSSVAGAPDSGPPSHQNLVMRFDAAGPAGWSWSGGLGLRSGGVLAAGVAAPPAGAGNSFAPSRFGYVSPATGGSATLSFATALRSVSLYWGSIDNFNTLDVLGPGGVLLRRINGGTLPPASGNQFSSNTNRRVFITAGNPAITGLTFRSTQAAFEFDDIAGQAVPEPASWAMLLAGFGLVGLAARRRRSTVAA